MIHFQISLSHCYLCAKTFSGISNDCVFNWSILSQSGGHQEVWCSCPAPDGAHFTPRSISPCQSCPVAALGSCSSQFCPACEPTSQLSPVPAQCLVPWAGPVSTALLLLGMGQAQAVGSCFAPSEKPSWLLVPNTPSPWVPWDFSNSLSPATQILSVQP